MRKYFIMSLCMFAGLSAMERDSGTTTKVKPKKCFPNEKSWRNASFFDCITNPWVPTTFFVASATKELISSYRNDSLPTLYSVKNTVIEAPRILMFSSFILLSCVFYSYYKPLLVSAYKGIKGKFYDEKKTCA